METEGISLKFTEEATKALARIAYVSNEQSENIGARRLQTVLEKLLEDISFEAPYLQTKEIVIDEAYVNSKLMSMYTKRHIKYIL